MAVATVVDVAIALGRPISTPAEQEQAEYWLGLVEFQIKSRLGDIALLDPEAVKYVETEAVAARMSNPEGYQSETIDDYTYRYASTTRQITITDAWWALLTPRRRRSAFSVMPS